MCMENVPTPKPCCYPITQLIAGKQKKRNRSLEDDFSGVGFGSVLFTAVLQWMAQNGHLMTNFIIG